MVGLLGGRGQPAPLAGLRFSLRRLSPRRPACAQWPRSGATSRGAWRARALCGCAAKNSCRMQTGKRGRPPGAPRPASPRSLGWCAPLLRWRRDGPLLARVAQAERRAERMWVRAASDRAHTLRHTQTTTTTTTQPRIPTHPSHVLPFATWPPGCLSQQNACWLLSMA